LLSREVNLNTRKRRQLNALFALTRRVIKAYLNKERLDRLWRYRYEGAMIHYLNSFIGQVRWQLIKLEEKLADMLLNHPERRACAYPDRHRPAKPIFQHLHPPQPHYISDHVRRDTR
jgi:hypothetical protein